MHILGIAGRRRHTASFAIRSLAALVVLLAQAVPAAAIPASNVPLFYGVEVPPGGRGELDSVALWVNSNASAALLFLTDKSWDTVEIHDAINNTYVGRLGTSGSGLGEMQRPNGVAMAHAVPTSLGPRDILFVAERDNSRVSAWLVPYMYPLGSIGEGIISKPYGVTSHVENGVTQIWVTSTGFSPERIQVFDLSWTEEGLQGSLNQEFAVPGSSVLESIVIDPVSRRALVCDESNYDIMVYDLEGNLLTRFGGGHFSADPEGIDIYDTGYGTGYIIVSDQKSSPMEFEVFDRQTYERLGAFTGSTANTDGLTLTQAPLPNLPNGSLFAIHNDNSMHAYDWAEIATAMGLCINDCAVADTPGDAVPRKGGILASQPNPFNPSTTIHFRVAEEGPAILNIFDLQGRLVRTLTEAHLAPGDHQATWQGRDNQGRPMAAGIYFVQLMSSGEISTHKITLVK